MIRHIGEDDVRALLSMASALDAVEQGLRARALNRAHDVPRTSLPLPEGIVRILCASAAELGLLASKQTLITGASSGRGYLNLLDLRSGELRAIVESVHLSRIRTGAASGVATARLARVDATVHAVIGAGSQALAQIEAVSAVRPISEVRVWSRNAARLERFCRDASATIGVRVSPAPNAREAVRGAHVVTLITTARDPVIEGRWLEPGQHINAAGSNSLDRRELDDDGVRRCDRIVVDARDVAERECGDLLPLIQRGELAWRDVPELGDVLIGRVPGRRTSEEITLYESHGMGVQDLYAGAHVYRAMLARDEAWPPLSPNQRVKNRASDDRATNGVKVRNLGHF